MACKAREWNFDGIVGPTHNYAGLSPGNLASMANKQHISNPRAAALEGLAKMRTLMELGVPQAVLPPQERPHVPTLRRLGFGGSNAQVIESAYRHDPALLAACSSASAMWAANAATVSPSADCADRRVHFTPANLCGLLHRSIEAQTTGRILRSIFSDEKHFAHHDPLPAVATLQDEGAANQMRLVSADGRVGIEIFVYGRDAGAGGGRIPARFPARQARAASEAIARLHELYPSRAIFVQQNPAAIDAGAFHNDVVAVSYQDVLLHHELAYAGPIQERLQQAGEGRVRIVRVPADQVPLVDAVGAYLFNSQIVESAAGRMTLITPMECQQVESVKRYIDSGSLAGVIDEIVHVDVRQSMRNGGGPACLRLRIVLTEAERASVAANVFVDAVLLGQLEAWVRKHYREELCAADLRDVKLLEESRAALDELTRMLGMGWVYEFQR